MFTSTRTVKDPCRRKSDRHASVLSQKLLMTGPAHRQIANSKFIDSYADILYQLSHHGSPNSSVGKESTCNAGGPGLIPGSGRSPGEGIGYPLQYSGLENAMDCIVHGVTKSQTWLSDFHFLHSAPDVLALSSPNVYKANFLIFGPNVPFSSCLALLT